MAPSTDWFVAEKAITFDGWRTVHDRARPGYTIRISGATHLSFMDVPFLPQQDGAAVASMLAATTIGPERMWRITSDAVLAFFAKHLEGAERGLLDDPDPACPEIAFRASLTTHRTEVAAGSAGGSRRRWRGLWPGLVAGVPGNPVDVVEPADVPAVQ